MPFLFSQMIRLGEKYVDIYREFGVHPITVEKWKKEIQEQAKTLFNRINIAHRFYSVSPAYYSGPHY
jgi:alpha-D-ribose 1-methylphosphonate 5-triphosphate synthase subunit PhnL